MYVLRIWNFHIAFVSMKLLYLSCIDVLFGKKDTGFSQTQISTWEICGLYLHILQLFYVKNKNFIEIKSTKPLIIWHCEPVNAVVLLLLH